MKLVAATGNPHKLAEFQRILEPLDIQVISPAQLGIGLDVEETGDTFAENAAIKARELYRLAGLPTFADDSGLCVDALDGRPGVHSARYGGEDLDHPGKVRLLLEELRDIPQEKRAARFVSAIHCVLDSETEIRCEGICEGSVAFQPAGSDGFGYDPIFLVGDKTFAQLSGEEKDALSHRGKALERFVKELSHWKSSIE